MTEPKLLTEAEARTLWAQSHTHDRFIELLRERGLIAEEPEPVDPLRMVVDQIWALTWPRGRDFREWFTAELRARGVTTSTAPTPDERQ